MLVMHQPMDDDLFSEAGQWMRETYEEVRAKYEELFLREPPNKTDVQRWVQAWLLGETPRDPKHLMPDFPAYPGPPQSEKKATLMWNYEEMAQKRADENLAAQRENLEKGGKPGDHDKPPRLVSPFLSGMSDGLIRLIGRYGRGEVGGPEDGAGDEEEHDNEAQEA